MSKTEVWREHLHNIEFPREIGIDVIDRPGTFARKEVRNIQEYYNTIHKNKTNHLYTSLYSKQEISSKTYDKMFIDLDGGIEETRKSMRAIVDHIKHHYSIHPNVYCSGSGGYHIFLYFPNTKIRNRRAMRRWMKALVREAKHNRIDFDMAHVDTTVFGDVRQVSRIPYTMNHKTNKFCSPIRPEWSLSKIKDQINRPDTDLGLIQDESKIIPGELQEIDEQIEKEKEDREERVYDTERDHEYIEDLENILEMAKKVEDGRKRILSFLIIPRLLKEDRTLEETKEYCKEFLNRSGKPLHQYETLIEKMYERTRRGPSDSEEQWHPWDFETFFRKYPSIMKSI